MWDISQYSHTSFHLNVTFEDDRTFYSIFLYCVLYIGCFFIMSVAILYKASLLAPFTNYIFLFYVSVLNFYNSCNISIIIFIISNNSSKSSYNMERSLLNKRSNQPQHLQGEATCAHLEVADQFRIIKIKIFHQ